MLCLNLGYTKTKLLAEIDSEEFSFWWRVYKQMGLPHPWFQSAIITSAIYNSQGGKTKIEQFMPVDKKTEMTAQEMMLQLSSNARKKN